MIAATVFEMWSLQDLERVTASVGVGPRTGGGKRTKEQMEWYVLSRFLEKAIPTGIFRLPVAGRNGSPAREEPDYVLMRAGTNRVIALVKITEATMKRTSFLTNAWLCSDILVEDFRVAPPGQGWIGGFGLCITRTARQRTV
jgi:hypothetical protein